MGVRSVGIVQDGPSDKELSPDLLSFGSGQSFELEGAFDSTDSGTFDAYHADDALHDGHGLLVYLVAVPGGVVAEAVVRALGGDDLTLSSLPELPSAAPLGDLEALVAGDLVQYAG